MDENKKKHLVEGIENAGMDGAAYEIVQRYGDAAKQHYVAYSGLDNETGESLAKGLKQISKEKINPDYEYQNIHQQAGFSAEVKDVARTNAEKIINGDSTRKTRTDDLGSVNDPLYDTVMVDADGNVIEGSGAQMKFLGASENDPTGEGAAARALDKLQSKKFQKYLDADAKIEVPSEQYDKIVEEANAKIDKLTKQLDNQKQAGNSEQIQKLQDRIEKLEKIKKNLRKSSVSSDEAVFARLHPGLSTAIDVAQISHRAGLQAAKNSALIGGSVSVVKNLVLVCKGEEEPEEAIKNVAKDTASSAASAYAKTNAGTALKGAMQNSKSELVRSLSKTNLPVEAITFAIFSAKTLSQYFAGEIDGVECLEALGEQGTGMVASSVFALIGQAAIPIPVVGGVIGGMVGYALSSATYGLLTEALKDAKLAKAEREQIEKICDEHIKMLRAYREEIEIIINEYLIDSMETFRDSFSGIKNALAIGDVDWVVDSANTITEAFGGKVAFTDTNDFNKKMLSNCTFRL